MKSLKSTLHISILLSFMLLLPHVVSTGSQGSREGYIKECRRSLALLEPDVVIYTNEIVFVPGKEDSLPDGRVIFEYALAEDYKDTIALIEAQDPSRQGSKLKIERSDKSVAFKSQDTTHKESEFLWYQIDVTQLLNASKDGTAKLQVKEFHKRRRSPYPATLDI